MLAGVEALVAQSLLQQTRRRAEARFVMLETIHEYARERLEAAGRGGGAAAGARGLLPGAGGGGGAATEGAGAGAWLARLEAEHDNLRAALGWAHARAAAGPPSPAGPAPLPWPELRLATALWRFWYTRGYLIEGRMRLEGTLTSAVASAAPPALRAQALYGASALVHRQGDLGRAAALAEESLALARTAGTRHGIADALNMRGNIAADQGDTAHAAACYAESLALRRALDDTKGIIGTLINLGELARVQGDNAAAAGLFEESVAMARAEGYGRLQAIAANNLGLTAHAAGGLHPGRGPVSRQPGALRERWGPLVHRRHAEQYGGGCAGAGRPRRGGAPLRAQRRPIRRDRRPRHGCHCARGARPHRAGASGDRLLSRAERGTGHTHSTLPPMPPQTRGSVKARTTTRGRRVTVPTSPLAGWTPCKKTWRWTRRV